MPRFYKIADMQASERKRSRNEEEEDDEVPLHILLELIFNEDTFIPRELMENLLNRATRVVPLTLLKPWRKLKKAIEHWMSFHFQCLGQPGTSRGRSEQDLQPAPSWALQLRRIPKRRRIVHDVFPARDCGEAQAICNEIIKRFELGNTTYSLAAVALHTTDTSIPHVHTLHDCSWSNGGC